MMDPDFKGNQTVEDCLIDQKKEVVTVRCGGGGAPMSGEVVDRRVSWRFKGPDGTSVVWSGRLSEGGSKIVGTWQFRFVDGDSVKGKFTARRLTQ
jgi:hypothetical protein